MGIIKRKKVPLWLKIVIGMILGILWGMVSLRFNLEKFSGDWIKPWGTIFIKLLKLTAIPLVFVSLVKGITSITDFSKLSRIGLKTFLLYICTTVLSISIGLLLVNTLKPGSSFSEEKKMEYQQKYSGNIEDSSNLAMGVKDKSPLSFVEEIVPENIFDASSDNSKLLQVIFFALLFSIAISLLEEKKVTAVKELFFGLNEIIFKIIGIIMEFSPIGVFALLATLIVDFSGDTDLFLALGKYFGLTMAGLLFLIFVQYPVILKLFTRVRIARFYKAILPAQMLAFSTSSSAAALPVTMKQATEKLGISSGVANFVFPVGATINMDGGSFYQAVSAVFIAQVFGLDLTLSQQLTIVLVATLSSIGAPGMPGGAIIMVILVLTSVGIPTEGLALILGIDRPLDMLRTAVNVTGDAAVASVVASSEKEIDVELNKETDSITQTI